MTERLQRIQALLRAGNVPCALSSRSGIGTVLHAGTPDHGPWDVLLRDSGGELWIHDAGGAVELPYDATDTTIANAVKIRVVKAWADHGDPEAKALIAMLQDASQPHHSAYRPLADQSQRYVPAAATAQFVDPLQLAEQMFDAANRIGRAFLTGHATSVAFSLSSPWGTYRSGYTRG